MSASQGASKKRRFDAGDQSASDSSSCAAAATAAAGTMCKGSAAAKTTCKGPDEEKSATATATATASTAGAAAAADDVTEGKEAFQAAFKALAAERVAARAVLAAIDKKVVMQHMKAREAWRQERCKTASLCVCV